MGKILLVTTRRCPGKPAFKYAAQLCRETGADLKVVQIRPGRTGAPGSRLTDTEKVIRLSEEQGVQCTMEVLNGQTDKEIVRFAADRRDILIVVYDKRGIFVFEKEKYLASQLDIPFVTVYSGHLLRNIKTIRKFFTVGNIMFGKIRRFFKGTNKVENPKAVEVPAMAKEEETHEEAARLVVVGRESVFSDSMVDYALEMAGRMDYQIIALNTAPLSCDTFRLFKSASSQICGDFEELSCKNVMSFEQKARGKDIDFTHVIKFVETDEALEEIQQEYGEIGFIVSEPENQHPLHNREKNENRPSTGLCVYSMC
ncbi:MAG TPA: universal stress protein [Desulfobacterales bacterium]|nr:universal stress protein [Desulfobacterales bacterium]